MSECPYCGGPVVQPASGRRRRWCKDEHRVAGRLEAARCANEVVEVGRLLALSRAQKNVRMVRYYEARLSEVGERRAILTGKADRGAA